LNTDNLILSPQIISSRKYCKK